MKNATIISALIFVAYLCLKLPQLLNIPKDARQSNLIPVPASSSSQYININESSIWWFEGDQLKHSILANEAFQLPKGALPPLQKNFLDQPHLIKHQGSWYLSGLTSSQNIEVHKSQTGKTWTKIKEFGSPQTGVSFPHLYVLAGQVHLAWMEAKNQQHSLVSTNLERQEEKLVLDSKVCDCCPFAIESISAGRAAIAYRDHRDDNNRPIQVLLLEKNQSPQLIKLTQEPWITESCPINGPSLSYTEAGLGLAWFNGHKGKNRVHWAHSSNLQKFQSYSYLNIPSGSHGRVAMEGLDRDSYIIAWVGRNESQQGRIFAKPVQRDGTEGPLFELAGISLSHKAGGPKLANRDGSLYLAWTSLGRDTVMVRRFKEGFFTYSEEERIFEQDIQNRTYVYQELDLVDVTGRTLDIKEKDTLLVFWASWCQPCLDEIPDLNRIFEKRTDLQIVSINLDEIDQENLVAISKKLEIRYPIVADPKGDYESFFKVVALPTAIMLDKNGKESWRVLGKNKKILLQKLQI